MSAVSKNKMDQDATNDTAIVGKQFAAFVCDENSAQAVGDAVKAFDWSIDGVHQGGIKSAVLSVAASTSPKFLVVDISNSAAPSEDINALADVCAPGTIVIAIGEINDVKLYRNLIASGVQDYVVKPIVPDVLRDAIALARQALEDPLDDRDHQPAHHKVVGIMGVRGGVGASTIATSAAWIAANELDRKTALLDLDIQFGTSALSFDLEPGRGLNEALENPSRVDGLFIDRASVSYGKNLSILGAEAPLSEPLKIDDQAIHHLSGELRKSFEVLIMDIPRGVLTAHSQLLDDLDELFLVADLSLAAVRDVIRTQSFIKSIAPKLNVHVIVNKADSAAFCEISTSDFEASLDLPVKWTLPLDRKTMLEASRAGRSLPEATPRARLTEEIRRAARYICGLEESTTAAKTGLFKGLLKGGK